MTLINSIGISKITNFQCVKLILKGSSNLEFRILREKLAIIDKVLSLWWFLESLINQNLLQNLLNIFSGISYDVRPFDKTEWDFLNLSVTG